jgi:hypothetical protein
MCLRPTGWLLLLLLLPLLLRRWVQRACGGPYNIPHRLLLLLWRRRQRLRRLHCPRALL